jgi:ferredoxin
MVHVDNNLCTGCGICLDACTRGAISLTDSAAHIDQSLCNSCGRCIDLCLTGAIIPSENGSGPPPEGTPAPLEKPLLSAAGVPSPSAPGACRATRDARGCRGGKGRGRGRGFGGGQGSGAGRGRPGGSRAGR